MASTALSFTASPSVLPMASSVARTVGLSPHSVLPSPKSSMPSLVVRAKRYGGEPKRDISQTPLVKQTDTHRMKSFLEPSHDESEHVPWIMEEKDDVTEIWFKMPGIAVTDIYVYVKDNKLYIQERNNVKPFRRMMVQPFENVQLPPKTRKEGIVAELGNGILYIYAPKTTKPELPYDIPIETVSW